MRLSLIATHDLNFGISKDGVRPWFIPEDEERFKNLTWGSTLIMSQALFESLPEGRPYRGRTNIVVSADPKYADKLFNNGLSIQPDKSTCLIVAYSYDDAMSIASQLNKDIFFIGGEKLFERAIKDIDDMYITIIFEFFDCDKHFPNYKENFNKNWEAVSLDPEPEDGSEYDYRFYHLKRKKKATLTKMREWLGKPFKLLIKAP